MSEGVTLLSEALVIICIVAVLGLTACQRSDVKETAPETVRETQTTEVIAEEILQAGEEASEAGEGKTEEEEYTAPAIKMPRHDTAADYVSVESSCWEETYIDYIKYEMRNKYECYPRYALAYIDNDDIPELVRVGDEEEGSSVISYNNGFAMGTSLKAPELDWEDTYDDCMMIDLLSYMESGVSMEALETPVISETASDKLTEGQRVVILECLKHLLDYYYDRAELRTEDMTTEEIVSYVDNWVFCYGNFAVIIPVDHEPVPGIVNESGGQYYFSQWYDKDSVLKKLGDFLGRTITEEDIESDLDPFNDSPVFMIDGDAIGTFVYSARDGVTTACPRIEDYKIEDEKLILSVPFEMISMGYMGDCSSHATVVFRVNPDSFFGYSLESIKFDGNYFEVDENDLGTVDTESGLSAVQSHIIGVSASSILRENGIEYLPTLMVDGDLATAWSPEIPYNNDFSFPAMMITLDEPYTVSGFTIYNGYQKSSDLYYKNSRPRKIQIYTSENPEYGYPYFECELKDEMGPQTIIFDQPVNTSFIRMRIWSVYEGTDYKDTLISEIELN